MDLDQLIAICKSPGRNKRLKSITKEAMVDILSHSEQSEGESQVTREILEKLLQEIQQMRQVNERVVGAL